MKTRRKPFRVWHGRDIQRGPDVWTLSIQWAPLTKTSPGDRIYTHGIDISWRKPLSWFKY